VPPSACRCECVGATRSTAAISRRRRARSQQADVDGFAGRRRDSEARGRLRGLGFAYHIKGTGGSPHENVDIRFEADGTVSLITGTQTIGQGTRPRSRRSWPSASACPTPASSCAQGDTDLIPTGGGHGSSRATYMGGTAIWRASDEIIAKGRRVASDALEAAEADIVFEAGIFTVARHRPPHRSDGGGGARARRRHAARHLSRVDPRGDDVPNGTHVVEVEIGPRHRRRDLGALHRVRRLRRDGQSDGRVGQVHGGIAQGIGQALLERAVYDPGSGQLVAGSFMDYAIPRAHDLPSFGLAFNPTRCTTNPWG